MVSISTEVDLVDVVMRVKHGKYNLRINSWGIIRVDNRLDSYGVPERVSLFLIIQEHQVIGWSTIINVMDPIDRQASQPV